MLQENKIIELLPQVLSGDRLIEELGYLPAYNETIIEQSQASRLLALSDIYRVYVPSEMSIEIYNKLYLALCKRVGITHTLIKFMPLCKACIDEYAETDDEYHARIIVWAYRKLKAEKTDGEIIRVSEIHKLTSEWKENIIRALPYMAKFADQEMINEIDALAREKHWHRNLVD